MNPGRLYCITAPSLFSWWNHWTQPSFHSKDDWPEETWCWLLRVLKSKPDLKYRSNVTFKTLNVNGRPFVDAELAETMTTWNYSRLIALSYRSKRFVAHFAVYLKHRLIFEQPSLSLNIFCLLYVSLFIKIGLQCLINQLWFIECLLPNINHFTQ